MGCHVEGEAEISIHSLVKRETFGADAYRFYQNNFNPLPRKEGDN